MTKAEQNTLRLRNTAIKKRYERRYVKPFYLALREQKKAVIDAAKQDIHAAYSQISLISPEPLMKEYRRMYYKVVPHEADREYARLSTTKAFGVNIDWLSDITDFLNDYMLDNIVRPMTARTMERMYRSLNTGLSTGMSNDEIIKSLEDVDIDKVRARLITRTEATRAAEFASHLGANQHDFKVKRVWISAHDRRTRGAPTPEGVDDKSDHYHMNGMEVQEGELFIDPRNGAKYLYPGDSTNGAQAANVCNCRCSCGYEGVRDKDGNLVMKDSPKPMQGGDRTKRDLIDRLRGLTLGKNTIDLDKVDERFLSAAVKVLSKEKKVYFTSVEYRGDRTSIMGADRMEGALTFNKGADYDEVIRKFGMQKVIPDKMATAPAAIAGYDEKDRYLELIVEHEVNHAKHWQMMDASIGGYGDEYIKASKKWLKNWDETVIAESNNWQPSRYANAFQDNTAKAMEWLAEANLLHKYAPSQIESAKIKTLLDEFNDLINSMNAK